MALRCHGVTSRVATAGRRESSDGTSASAAPSDGASAERLITAPVEARREVERLSEEKLEQLAASALIKARAACEGLLQGDLL